MSVNEFNSALLNLNNKLTGFAYSLTSDEDDSKDLLQETYLKALLNRNKFMEYEHQNIQGWTFTIMKNIFINNYRRKKFMQNSKDGNDLQQQEENMTDTSINSNPEKRRYLGEIMEQHIQTLTENQKVPLELHIQGYKYDEISEILHTKIGTVKSRIHSARKNLLNKIK